MLSMTWKLGHLEASICFISWFTCSSMLRNWKGYSCEPVILERFSSTARSVVRAPTEELAAALATLTSSPRPTLDVKARHQEMIISRRWISSSMKSLDNQHCHPLFQSTFIEFKIQTGKRQWGQLQFKKKKSRLHIVWTTKYDFKKKMQTDFLESNFFYQGSGSWLPSVC